MGEVILSPSNLLGIGLYTPAEAERLIQVPAHKISRWLKGHSVKGRHYKPLWRPQVDLGDDHVYLGFRDLMEMRTAHAFMERGVSAIAIRRAVAEAARLVDDERPLSTTKFKTDGRDIFLEIVREDGGTQLVDIFRKQYAFQKLIEQSLSDVDFDGIAPGRCGRHRVPKASSSIPPGPSASRSTRSRASRPPRWLQQPEPRAASRQRRALGGSSRPP